MKSVDELISDIFQKLIILQLQNTAQPQAGNEGGQHERSPEISQ